MEEKVKQQYDRWLSQSGMPTDLAEELKRHCRRRGMPSIPTAFGRELEFGTGGLRGVIGAGTNRMNVYTIRKATQGLANYLKASDLPKRWPSATTAASRAMCSQRSGGTGCQRHQGVHLPPD